MGSPATTAVSSAVLVIDTEGLGSTQTGTAFDSTTSVSSLSTAAVFEKLGTSAPVVS